MRFALLVMLSAGCTKEATLTQLTSKVLRVSVSATGGLGVELQYDDSQQCLTIGNEVHVTFSGETLELYNKGDQSLSSTGDSCVFPLWEAPSPDVAPEVTTFVLSDRSAMISASFDSLFATRGYTLVSSQKASAGDTVAIAWTPRSDDYDPTQLEIIFAPNLGTGGTIAKGAEITVALGELSFVLPTGVSAGAGQLIISGDAKALVSSCVGVDRCEATFQVAQLIPFTVQ